MHTHTHYVPPNLINVLPPGHLSPATPDSLLLAKDLLNVYNSPEMKELICETRLLASVDLSTLDSCTKLTAFYSNVVNFLYAHCVMVCAAGEDGEGSALLRGQASLAELQKSSVLQAAVFSHLGYRVGQLGLVSCHDLHYSILRRGLSSLSLLSGAPLHCRIGGQRAIGKYTYVFCNNNYVCVHVHA